MIAGVRLEAVMAGDAIKSDLYAPLCDTSRFWCAICGNSGYWLGIGSTKTSGGRSRVHREVPLRAAVFLHADEPFAAQVPQVVRNGLLRNAKLARDVLLRGAPVGPDQPEDVVLEVAQADALVPRDLHLHGVESLEDPIAVRLDEPLDLKRAKVVRQRPVRHLEGVLQGVVVFARVRGDVSVDLSPDEVVEDFLFLHARIEREEDEVRQPVLSELRATDERSEDRG